MINRTRSITILFLIAFSFSSLHAQMIQLAGEWKLALDRDDKGIAEKWFNRRFTESIILPGSLAERNKGDEVTLSTKWTGSIYDSSFFFRPDWARYRAKENLKIPFWLTPAKYYAGRAWYQKEIVIPADWQGKYAKLFLERVHTRSRLWIDATEIGRQHSLSTAHEYDLKKLAPGKHLITLCIDNRLDSMNVGPDSRSVTDQAQGNWNGIIGKMYVQALPAVQIEDVQIYPDIHSKKVRLRIRVYNRDNGPLRTLVTASAESFNTSQLQTTQEVFENLVVKANDSSWISLDLPMTDNVALWSEFDPALYRLTVKAEANDAVMSVSRQFGMREFSIQGTRFALNGQLVHLRGTVNNCEFPLTGYPPMDAAAWEKIFKKAKSYGLNHMRFHSWCPPEAAFIAADRNGFYLQVEAPTWPNHGTSLGDGRFIDNYVYEETNAIVKAYGNYASFCMLSGGNEPAGRQQGGYLASFINYWRAKDNRRVYTGASVGMNGPLVPANDFMVRSGPRGLKWIDSEPESATDYTASIQGFSVPYVTHEMGQWCSFPDFSQLKKYTGVYRPRNLELFRDELAAHGMAEQAKDFLASSGKLQALCYKAEIEKSLRTPHAAGFQLSSLIDFPGQGTAPIGVLDAFWDEKGYITAKEFSRFCAPTVIVARLPHFVFANTDTLVADIELYHFARIELRNVMLNWTLTNDRGDVVHRGNFKPGTYGIGSNQQVGQIRVPLNGFPVAAHLKLEVSFDKLPIANDWEVWVYPEQKPSITSDIYHCTQLDATAQTILSKGGKVFLDAAGGVVKGKEVSMYFTPVSWNTSWFQMRPPHTTGSWIQAGHPAFADFPTSTWTNYQWWGIVQNAQVMHLEEFPAGLKPLVQPIDTWFMNRKLALVFEAKVGEGKLMVSSANLSDTASNPAARQLYYSINRYMASDQFNPAVAVPMEAIRHLFTNPSVYTWQSFNRQHPDELKPATGNK